MKVRASDHSPTVPPMAFADLHVHSLRVEMPSGQRLSGSGMVPSAHPLALYQRAKARGMTYVTITDHNRIDGVMLLVHEHPFDAFTGVELTTAFPEDGCKIHVLVYGFSKRQFETMNHLRPNIYDLREYLLQERLAHAVAHATYSLEPGILTADHLERMILLFNAFEARNGSRAKNDNDAWHRLLASLTPRHIAMLRRKHGIEPAGEWPWLKHFTGGSDDHGGLFIGRTYTGAPAGSMSLYLQSLVERGTTVHGRHLEQGALALSMYTTAADFLKARGFVRSNRLGATTSDASLAYHSDRGAAGRRRQSWPALRNWQRIQSPERETKHLCRTVSRHSDRYIRFFCRHMERNASAGRWLPESQGTAAIWPLLMPWSPFFAGLKRMSDGRGAASGLCARLGLSTDSTFRRVMFFVDPCGTGKGKADADTLFQNIYELCGNNWMIVTTERCGTASGGPSQRHFVSLPIVYPINIFYSDRGAAHVPSLMRSLELIEAQDPDTIVLCTSGPIGLMGLIVAGLHHIRLVRASAGAEEATRNKDPIIHFAAACIRSLSARTSELQGSANGSTGPNEEQTERIVAAARYARYLVYSLFSNPEASPEPLRSVA